MTAVAEGAGGEAPDDDDDNVASSEPLRWTLDGAGDDAAASRSTGDELVAS